jgi:hypothetical protein
MSSREWHKIWTEQCEAARDIRTRYGLTAALDYLITEKLLNFAEAAADHPEFARELPQFVSQVRRIFTAEEIRAHVGRLEHEFAERHAGTIEDEDEDEDDCLPEDPAAAVEQEQRFVLIRELLTASDLGTS